MRRPPKPKRAAAAATFLLSLSLLLLPLGFVATHRAFSGGVAAASTSTARRVLLGDDAHANAAANADADAAAAAEHEAAVERHCAGTLHRDVCASTLATIPDLAQKPVRDVISAVVARAAAAVRASASNCSAYLRRPAGAGALRVRDRLALSDCVELLGHTLAQLGTAEAELSAGNRTVTDEESVAGVQTVLSAALTNQYTCLDGFAGPSASEDGRVRPYIQGRIYHVAHLVSNSLAMLRRLPQQRRRGREALELEGYGRVRRGFPSWLSAADRRRLQQQVVPLAPDLVVAKDGSGNFTTVGEAVAAAPNNSETRFVIYIKAGGYLENVEVGSEKTNLMFVGDGMWRTVIKASRNVVDNSTTFRSATLDSPRHLLASRLLPDSSRHLHLPSRLLPDSMTRRGGAGSDGAAARRCPTRRRGARDGAASDGAAPRAGPEQRRGGARLDDEARATARRATEQRHARGRSSSAAAPDSMTRCATSAGPRAGACGAHCARGATEATTGPRVGAHGAAEAAAGPRLGARCDFTSICER